jgi:hypothetical protein
MAVIARKHRSKTSLENIARKYRSNAFVYVCVDHFAIVAYMQQQ